MPITIQQSPTSPNMANADLIYVVTSTTSSSPQYQFVCDIKYSGSGDLLQRVKQQPNTNNYGVFNVGQILTNYLDIDPVWKAAPFATASNTSKDFLVTFGEEYSTSVSGTVSLYTGIGSAIGNPGVSSSNEIFFVGNGLVEPNSGDWNFPSQSFYSASDAPAGTETFAREYALTNAPRTQKIQDGEYHTIALYNGNLDGSDIVAQDLYFYEVKVYNSAGTNIQTINWYNTKANGGGPRTSNGQEWSDVYNTQTSSSRIIYAGTGPQNFADSGSTLNTAWSYYTVTWYSQESAGIENTNGTYSQITFTKDTAACDFEGVRFAWKNQFGVWDYYTARLATNSSVQIERNAYNKSFVDYSTSTSNVGYNINRRGDSQFYNKLTQTKVVTTDFLNQTDADWIKELIFSTQVYVQEGSDFLPVVITDATVTEKTNPRSQKLFNYTIAFQYANQLRPRL